jgi:hypothetical protein
MEDEKVLQLQQVLKRNMKGCCKVFKSHYLKRRIRGKDVHLLEVFLEQNWSKRKGEIRSKKKVMLAPHVSSIFWYLHIR